MLLEVTAAADRWEQTWCSQLERGVPPGIVAIGLSANRRTRKIMLALADGPLAVKDLQARLPELRRTTLRRRLSNLILEGLLERQDVGRIQLYELTVRARHLAIVAMLAGRWEWQWSRPAHAVPASDFIDLLHMLAPIARGLGADGGRLSVSSRDGWRGRTGHLSRGTRREHSCAHRSSGDASRGRRARDHRSLVRRTPST